MQAKGSLKETALRSLLEGAQSERATGTLTVKNDGEAYTLYFLFGHLFHANGQGAEGDDAVVGALRCHDGEYSFDSKAKLPADETVKSSISELVSTAGENGSGPGRVTTPVAVAPGEPPAIAAQAEPAAMSVAEPSSRDRNSSTSAKPAEAAENASRRGVKHRPQPRHGREPIPVPAGEVIYDSLKTSFVDFPRLITTLESEGYTGYVRLLTDQASGLILFREGVAQECVFDPGENFTRGRDALMSFNNEVTQGHGVLDVVGLPVAIVDGLYDLVVARPIYTELFASWVDMPALLEYLAGQKLTGSVMVRATGGTGIIILTEGKPTGAFTTDSRSIENDPKVVLDLCADRSAMIEVKAADDNVGRPPLEVDQVVGSRGKSRGGAQPATSTTAPSPPAAPIVASSTPAAASGSAGIGPGASVADTRSMPALESPESPPPSIKSASEGLSAGDPGTSAADKGGDNVDWEVMIEELQAMADKALGARSRKVKDLLGSAERTHAGVEGAVAQVSQISLLFVDSALLVKLEQDMRAQLQTHL